MTACKTVIIGCGSYLPENRYTNEQLSHAFSIDTSNEWIAQRTGILARHIAAEDEFTSHLAIHASRIAMADANVAPTDIDLVILATSTPDNTFPATAVAVQHALGIKQGFAFDMQAVCSGFVYALGTADAYIRSGLARRALVIGAETFSRILDWEDRTTCVLFGDGAGAVVVEGRDAGHNHNGRGILSVALRSDGEHRHKLYVDGGPSSTRTTGHLRMEGREVYRFAVSMVNDVIEEVLDKAGLKAADIDWFVPHQANQRIIESSAQKLGIPPEKVVITVADHGNTSAASIPLALDVARRDGRIVKGDTVLIEAIGGGFTWGAILFRI